MHRYVAIRSELLAFAGLLALLGSALRPSVAAAEPQLRTQMDLRGNFVLIGSSMAHDCAPDVPAPTTGTSESSSTETSHSGR